jgi:tripartite-type tricarboxylate transporter receptor subunit TctC
MKLARRKFLHFTAGAAALPAISRVATAQTYPSRPITMIVPFAAGGAADVVGRVVAERLGKALGQPVIVENIVGADGSIGVGRAASARPDGHTICLGYMDTNVLNGAFYSLSYNVLDDLVPISPINTSPFVLFARKTMPAADLNEFVSRSCPIAAVRRLCRIWRPGRLMWCLLRQSSGLAIGGGT